MCDAGQPVTVAPATTTTTMMMTTPASTIHCDINITTCEQEQLIDDNLSCSCSRKVELNYELNVSNEEAKRKQIQDMCAPNAAASKLSDNNANSDVFRQRIQIKPMAAAADLPYTHKSSISSNNADAAHKQLDTMLFNSKDATKTTNLDKRQTDQTANLNANKMVAPLQSTSTLVEQNRVPRRKLSVFSFDGFPNAQLLELKDRHHLHHQQQQTSTGEQRRMSETIGQQHRITNKASCLPPTGDPNLAHRANTNLVTNETSTVVNDSPTLGLIGDTTNSQGQKKARRSVRSDTLGSTGSSRASSCDEPTIVALGSVSSPSGPNSMSASSVLIQRKMSNDSATLNTVCSTSASNSSLDSIEDWPKGVQTNGQQQIQRQETNASRPGNSRDSITSSSSQKPALKSPPFESIRDQLGRNSIPNPSVIRSHIDNLISMNAVIIDNSKNLVNIRSYNSSRDTSNTSTLVAIPTKRPPCLSSGNLALLKTDNPASKQTGAPVAYAINKSSAYLQQGNSSILPTMAPLSTAKPEQPRQAVKRASTSSLPTGIEFEYAAASAAATITKMQEAKLASDEEKQLDLRRRVPELELANKRRSSLRTSRDPVHLESAIQNLSLKRKESEPEQHFFHHNQQHHPLFTLEQNRVPNAGYIMDQNEHYHRSSQNIMLSLQQQHEEQQQIVMASLLMDRHRHSLADYGSQASLLYQQQQKMIEQLDPYRLIALEQQRCQSQGHLGVDNDAMAKTMPAILASLSQTIQQPANYLHDDHLLKAMLMQAMPAPSSDIQTIQNLEHGGELLTQSLDSGKPSYTCRACDISFWTRDLLDYHLVTQCVARIEQPPARPTMSFDFTNYNNSNFRLQNSLNTQVELSKSVSPQPKPLSIVQGATSAASRSTATGRSPQTILQLAQERDSDSSMIRNQISASQQVASPLQSVSLGSLPFKKRKISEPNMKY